MADNERLKLQSVELESLRSLIGDDIAVAEPSLVELANEIEIGGFHGVDFDKVGRNYEAFSKTAGLSGTPDRDRLILDAARANAARVEKNLADVNRVVTMNEAKQIGANFFTSNGAALAKSGKSHKSPLDALADIAQATAASVPQTVGRMEQGAIAINDSTGRLIKEGLKAVLPDEWVETVLPEGPVIFDPFKMIEAHGENLESFGKRLDIPDEDRTFATDVGAAGAQITVQAVSTLFNPVLGIVGMISEGGEQMDRAAEAAGADGTVQGDIATVAGGVIVGATERIQIGKLISKTPYLGKLLDMLPDKLKAKWFTKSIDVLGAGGGEAFQETVEGVLMDATEMATFNKNVKFFREWEKEASVAGAAASLFRVMVNSVYGRRARLSYRADDGITEALAAGNFSPESFNAISEALTRDEFVGAFEGAELQSVALAAYNGNKNAQDMLHTFHQDVLKSRILADLKRNIADDKDKAAQPDFKLSEEEKVALDDFEKNFNPENDVELNAEEIVAQQEFDKIDPFRLLSKEEQENFLADKAAELTPEQEAEMRRLMREFEQEQALAETVDFSESLIDVVKRYGGIKLPKGSEIGDFLRIKANLKANKLGHTLIKQRGNLEGMKTPDEMRDLLAAEGWPVKSLNDMIDLLAIASGHEEVYQYQGDAGQVETDAGQVESLVYTRDRVLKRSNRSAALVGTAKISKSELAKLKKIDSDPELKPAERIALIRKFHESRLRKRLKELGKAQRELSAARKKESLAKLKESQKQRIAKLKASQKKAIDRVKAAAKEKHGQLRVSAAKKLRQAEERARAKLLNTRLAAARRLQREMDKGLKAARKAVRERKDINASIKALNAMVRSLPVKLRGKYQPFGELVGKVSREAQEKFLDKAENRIRDIFDSYIRKEGQDYLKGFSKRFSPERASDKRKLQQAFTPDQVRAIEQVLPMLTMSEQEVANSLDALLNKDGSIKGKDTEEQLANQERFINLSIFGGALNDNVNTAKVIAAVDAAKEMAAQGRSKAREFAKQRKKDVARMLKATKAEVLGKRQAKGAKAQEYERDNKLFAAAREGFYNWGLTRMQSFEMLTDSLTSTAGRFRGFLNQQHKRQFQAEIEENARNREELGHYRDRVYSALGIDVEGAFGLEKFRKAQQALKVLKSWSKVRGPEVTGIAFKDGDGPLEPQPMSVWQSISLWMQWQDTSLADTFEEQGIDESTIEKVEEFIGPAGIKVAKTMMEMYQEFGPKVSEVMERVDGVALDIIRNYSPIKRFHQNQDVLSDAATSTDYVRSTVRNNSQKSRVENTDRLVFQPADEVFIRHVNQMNHYIAWAQVAKDFRAIFQNPSVRLAIAQRLNQGALRVLDDMIDDMLSQSVNRHKFDGWMSSLISNVAVSKLAFNLTSAVKQLASVPAYLDALPPKAFAKGVADFWTDPTGNARILLDTDYIQNRIRQSYDRDLRQVAEKGTANALLDVRNLKDRFMFLTRYGDLGAILQGGWAVYKHSYETAVANGKSEQEAREIAEADFAETTDRAQQSALKGSLSHFQRSHTFMKLFTMFLTSPIQYHRITWGSIQAAKEGRITKKEALKTILIFHVLLPQIFTAMGSAFIGLWDDDEKTRKAFWMRQFTAAAVGNFNSLFMFGHGIEAFFAYITGDSVRAIEEGTPAVLEEIGEGFGGLAMLTRGGIEDDGDEMLKGAEFLASGALSLAGVPVDPIFSHIEGLYDISQGDTDHPVLRALGFSEWATFENKPKNKSGSTSFKKLLRD